MTLKDVGAFALGALTPYAMVQGNMLPKGAPVHTIMVFGGLIVWIWTDNRTVGAFTLGAIAGAVAPTIAQESLRYLK